MLLYAVYIIFSVIYHIVYVTLRSDKFGNSIFIEIFLVFITQFKKFFLF